MALRAKFDSIPQARLASKNGWNEANDYDQARALQRTVLNRLRRQKLSEERESFRAARQATSANIPHRTNNNESLVSHSDAAPEEGIDAILDAVFNGFYVFDILLEYGI